MGNLSIPNCQKAQIAHTVHMSELTREWLEGKYREWRNERPRSEDSIELFANHVGVSRNTMNNWLNRGQTPGVGSAGLLASKLGPEIYDLLGIQRPDPLLQVVIERWPYLTNEQKQGIAQQAEIVESRTAIGKGHSDLAPLKQRRKDKA